MNTMVLTNPTDQELRKAFGIHVAGWSEFPHEPKKCYDPQGLSCYWSDMPDWLENANAVLPWLDKWDRVTLSKFTEGEWGCYVCAEDDAFPEWEGCVGFDAVNEVRERAIVICLLRANGVSVEFT